MRTKLLFLMLAMFFANADTFSFLEKNKDDSSVNELCGYGGKKGCRVLYIGDSITDGFWGAADGKPTVQRRLYDMNHIYGHGYVCDCISYYMSKYPGKQYEFFNRGISGNKLVDLAARWQGDAVDLHPDVVSILIGTNDVQHYLDAKSGIPFDYIAWEKQYRDLLNQLHTVNPLIKFVLATPFCAKVGKTGERTDYEERVVMLTKLCGIIKHIADDYHAVYLPYAQLVNTTIKKYPDLPASYWIWDGIHPTYAMHYRMAQMWIKATRVK